MSVDDYDYDVCVSSCCLGRSWTDYNKRILYTVADVTPLLRSGAPNALAVTLGNGFYNVPPPSNGRYTKYTAQPFGPRALLAQLAITYSDGSSGVVSTSPGSDWMATDGGPIVFTHQYAGEDWNDTLAVPGWELPGFSPSAVSDSVQHFQMPIASHLLL